MEISERELRRMVADSDDQHRAAMATFTEDNRELIFETGPSRRRFLAGLGLGSAALVVGSAVLPMGKLVPRAWSQTTPSDGDIATFAASVEYAAVAAYQAAAKSGKVKTPAILAAATAFAGQHQQHGDAFKAAGTNPNVMANKAVLDMVTPQLTAAKTENDVVALAYGLENAAAATYIFALGVLNSEKAYNAVASVMPVEAQHAIALGFVLGKTLDDKAFMPSFEKTDGFLDPAKFPVG
ncbi:MAG TPA: ferritin-like domain-containing protein [Acidimicrobiia bacterium]